MKVSEAKTKVCPFISGVVGNATDVGEYVVNCMCGDCMSWEYTKTHEDVETMFSVDVDAGTSPKDKVEFKRLNQPHKGKGQMVYFGIPIDECDKYGYCQRLIND